MYYVGTHTKINGNNYRTLLFTDLSTTDIIFMDIINHSKVFSVKVMSVIIMTDKVAISVVLSNFNRDCAYKLILTYN